MRWIFAALTLGASAAVLVAVLRPVPQDQCAVSKEETMTYQRQVSIGFQSCGKNCSMPNFVYEPITSRKWSCVRWKSEEQR
jgi:hypothetical protein